jgi:tight adherence protein B
VVCALIVAAIAGLVFEPVSTLAAALVVGPGWRRWHERRRAALRVSEAEAMAEALRTMVAELRAGAPPVAATEAAAVEAPPKAAKALRAAVASAGLGVATGAGALAQLTTAWTLAAQHGLPMADVLDAIRRDLDAAARFANRTRAGMAGPRASASILVLLPFVGIALGEAMGANPLRILVTTSPGNVLLLAGSGLICAGMAWSARLTGQVTPW